MDGMGILKGLGVTLKRFVDTYLEDVRWLGKRYYTKEGIDRRMSSELSGYFYDPIPRRKAACPRRISLYSFLVV